MPETCFAVGAALDAGRQTAHDLAQVAGRGGTRGGDRIRDQRAQLVLGEGGGQVGGDDVGLGALLLGEVGSADLRERLDRLAAALGLSREHADELVVRKGATSRDLCVVGSREHHAQGVALERVPVPHGGRHISLESIREGHCVLLGRPRPGGVAEGRADARPSIDRSRPCLPSPGG